MTIEIKDPMFEVEQLVTIKFAGNDFGEWEYETGTICDRNFDLKKDKWFYDIIDTKTNDKYKEVPEHQLS